MIGMRLARGARARRRDPLAPVLRAAAQGRRLLGELGADGGAVRRRRPRRQAHVQARRLVAAGCPRSCGRVRTVAPGGSLRARLDRLLAIKAEGEVTRALMQARCDRGAEIALLLGFERETAEAIRALDEHWDGGGQPRGLRGEEIPLLGRILCLAQTAEIFHAAGGVEAAWRVARRRRGGWFDPALVDALGAVRRDAAFWESLPERRRRARGSRPTACCRPTRRRLDAIAVRVRGRRRREVAVDVPPLRPHVPDRARPRRRARRGRRRAARPAPRRAAARRRQARDLQPDPRQARRAHRRRVRPRSASTR